MSHPNLKHTLRYGTAAEQKFISEMSNSYDILAINGNMLAHATGSISNFILMNFINKMDKGFFIDPITHAFQHNLDLIKSASKKEKKLTIKKSIEKLIKCYGEPIESKVLVHDQNIIPEDFNTRELNHSFCKAVIDFQLNTIYDLANSNGFCEYLPPSSCLIDKLRPLFAIAPYFYITSNTIEDWLDLNIEFINISRELYPDNQIYAQLVISKDILMNPRTLRLICSKYAALDVDGILLWIDDFNEHEVSSDLLFNYASLLKALYHPMRKIFNLYGGFFSVILTSNSLSARLDGVGHGLEYGEYRAVVPVGGGIPTSKYYYYPLHCRIDYKTSTELLQSLGILGGDPFEGYVKYLQQICSCPVCKEELSGDINKFRIFENTEFYTVNLRGSTQRRTYASQETKGVCVKHYLYNKYKEFRVIEKCTIEDIINDLDMTYEKYRSLRKLSLDSTAYMRNWSSILKQFIENG